MLTERSFQAGEVRIHYAEGPAGGTPLVILHGLTGRWQEWLPVLPLFSFRYHTYTLDLRGNGLSSHTPGCYRVQDYGKDVILFLRERVREPAVVLGHSLGAEIAWWVAAHASDLVRAAVLEDPPIYVARDYRMDTHPVRKIIATLYDHLQTRPSVGEIAATVKSIFPEIDNASAIGWSKTLSLVDTDTMAQVLSGHTWADCQPDELLAKITAPVLLLQGNPALDGMLEHVDVERALGKLANCVHVYCPDAGHGIRDMNPMFYFQLVSNFLESL